MRCASGRTAQNKTESHDGRGARATAARGSAGGAQVLPGHFLVHWPHKLAEWADQKERNSHIGEVCAPSGARARGPQYRTGRSTERTAGRGQVLELTESFKFETGTEARPPPHLPTLRPAVPPATFVSSPPAPAAAAAAAARPV